MRVEGARPLHGLLLCIPLVCFLSLALGYPLVALIRLAAGGSLIPDHVAGIALRNSLLLSLTVAILSTAVSIVPAWVLARWPWRARALVRTALTLPLTFSGIVVGFLAILLLGRTGIVPRAMEAVLGYPLLSGAAYGATGLLIAYLYFEIPRATLSLESAFREIDVAWEAAAATLGLDARQRFFRLIAPLVFPSLLGTILLTFSVSLGSFGVALLLSRRLTIVPIEIYTSFTGLMNDQRAASLSLLLMLIAMAAGASSALLRRRA